MTQKNSGRNKKSVHRTVNGTSESDLFSGSKVIRRPGKNKSRQETTVMQETNIKREEVMPVEPIVEQELIAMNPATVTDAESPSLPDNTPQNSHYSSPTLPPIAGFDLEGLSLNQQYAIRNAVVLCDCCVDRSPDAIFAVLGRNFLDTGALMWWLRRIGKGHVADTLKGKDIVDACRKAAHMLDRQLKREIGQPVPRW